MDIRSYYDSLPNGGRRALAKDLNISPAYLYQMVTKIRPIAPKLCLAIQIVTEGAVTVHDLRPDIFGPAVGELVPMPEQDAAAPSVDRRGGDRRKEARRGSHDRRQTGLVDRTDEGQSS